MRRPTGWLILLTLVLVPCGRASAQTPQTPQAPRVQQPPGQPAPPLFPKHRRGTYINSDNIEVVDATPQSPPLETDDPGVPDPGEYEINLLTEADLEEDARTINVVTVDANYGLVLKGFGHELPTQLKFEFPVVAARQTGNPYEIGLGNYEVGLKFNFYNDESRGLRVSVYPQMAFSRGSSVDKGVAEAGQTFELPILISHETKFMTLVGNAGFSKAIHDEERGTTADIGAGIGRAFFRKLAVMAEVRTSSSIDFSSDRLVSTSLGFIYGVRKSIWYARVGHSLFSDDGRHLFLGFGMKVLIDTQHPTPARP
jgi:hypothetical protein